MQVYIVMGGWDYEGRDGDSLRLFDCKSTAQAYADELKKESYDYIDFKLMGVDQSSTFATV